MAVESQKISGWGVAHTFFKFQERLREIRRCGTGKPLIAVAVGNTAFLYRTVVLIKKSREIQNMSENLKK